MGYIRPEEDENALGAITAPKLPQPKIGDVVRYFDVDGGKSEGEVLVGKISYIQPILSGPESDDGTNKWLVEIKELEDVGDGYFTEYPSRKRRKALRKLEELAPVPASFVRSEDAFKIPLERGTNRPSPSHSGYDLVGYEGPGAVPVNDEIVATDAEAYEAIKFSLIRNAAIAGAAGTAFAGLARDAETAVIYAAGAAAGVAYLFLLGVKTDTMGSPDAKLGKGISNLRFAFPAMVIVGVALKNSLFGGGPSGEGAWMFSTVTSEQFAAAMIGFLTYRLPLFLNQLAPIIGETATDLLPGSAGIAVRMAQEAKQKGVDVAELKSEMVIDDGLIPVFLVSGPEGTGKTTLVNKLLESDDRFVAPTRLDRMSDGIKFERLEARDEFLQTDGRFGLTKASILETALMASEADSSDDDSEDAAPPQRKVVVVDADVNLAKKLASLAGARLIGVWVGLDSLEKFESRIKNKIASGAAVIPSDETEEEFLRGKVRTVVKDIEYGVVSGVFEFTILNEDVEESMTQLKEAAEYCFK